MTTLVECWNKLEGNVGELNSWVTDDPTKVNFDDGTTIPLEQLEGQLNQLKVIFEEKEKLVSELEVYRNEDGTEMKPNEDLESKPVEEEIVKDDEPINEENNEENEVKEEENQGGEKTDQEA